MVLAEFEQGVAHDAVVPRVARARIARAFRDLERVTKHVARQVDGAEQP